MIWLIDYDGGSIGTVIRDLGDGDAPASAGVAELFHKDEVFAVMPNRERVGKIMVPVIGQYGELGDPPVKQARGGDAPTD